MPTADNAKKKLHQTTRVKKNKKKQKGMGLINENLLQKDPVHGLQKKFTAVSW